MVGKIVQTISIKEINEHISSKTIKRIINVEFVSSFITPCMMTVPFMFGLGAFKLGVTWLIVFAVGLIYINWANIQIKKDLEYAILLSKGQSVKSKYEEA